MVQNILEPNHYVMFLDFTQYSQHIIQGNQAVSKFVFNTINEHSYNVRGFYKIQNTSFVHVAYFNHIHTYSDTASRIHVHCTFILHSYKAIVTCTWLKSTDTL